MPPPGPPAAPELRAPGRNVLVEPGPAPLHGSPWGGSVEMSHGQERLPIVGVMDVPAIGLLGEHRLGEIPASHRDLVECPPVAALTTVMADGYPQTSVVWCDSDGDCVRVNTMRCFAKERHSATTRGSRSSAVTHASLFATSRSAAPSSR